MRRRQALAGLAGLATPWRPAIRPAAAQPAWPARPIRLVVTWPPGGSADILARRLQPRLAAALGQPVVIDNRGGASGAIGAGEVLHAAPDGHTIGFVTSTLVSMPLLQRLPYDPVRDVAPVQLTARVANILVVHPSLPVHSVPDLIALAKRQPGRLAFGSPGIGSAVHISGEMFKLATGTEMTHIPYRGGGPALADLVGGQIQLMFGNASSTLPYVRDGSVRAIAVTSAHRAPYLPEIPTIAESGLPGFAIDEWYACIGPAGMAPAAVERLNAELNRIVGEPAERARLLDMGAEAAGGPPGEFGDFLRQEVDKIGRLVRAARISVE
ncbi:tripartite tricarboxylate transporter substrate binding protein [Roseomonas sp. NAR14]|uniref:Tripartite tricarboxylate transporter substrate binding protein n=1 Tax=Roseomonas acroporae TaxID=2937791 RepID=A0A9X2C019_9PROT|nr:tripartite tricarboxylate transporter substrate binding protein [Roseomonas acroporae]MCK8787665.1 tripartite tricarboxylate transporter substrate binding protein [Roseomonas acroporae]